MPKGNQRRGPNLIRNSVIIPQAVCVYPALQAITLHELCLGNEVLPKGTKVLVQPWNEGTAQLQTPILDYRIYLIEDLPPGDNPESKRGIELKSVCEVQLENKYQYANLPIIMKMPMQLRSTQEKDVRAFLKQKNHPQGTPAIIHSAGKKLFYMDQYGDILELDSSKVISPRRGWDRRLSKEEARKFYDQFDEFTYFNFIETYNLAPDRMPIFPTDNSPNLDEIQQRYIPDCFLLAALQSILTHKDGKNFIKGMFVDHYDGTVSVRIFDPETNAPLFVRVKKAILTENGKALNGHTALWVHLIETAYASLGHKGNKQVGPCPRAVFSGGGQEAFALKVLTGQDSKYTYSRLESKDVLPSFMNKDTLEIALQILNTPEFNEDAISAQFNMILPDVAFIDGKLRYTRDQAMRPETVEKLKELIRLYEKNQVEYSNILNNEGTSIDEKISKILVLLEKGNASQELIGLFRERKGELLIPFSGEYSQNTMEIYKTIEGNLNEGNLIAVGSRSQKEFTGTGFEPLAGIPGRHAYSVHRAFSREEMVNGEKRNIFYITVRNPWGTIGRSYERNASGELTGAGFQDNNNPYYDIELNEFVAAMDIFTVFEQKNIFHYDKLKEHFLRILNGNSFSFSENMRGEELLENKRALDDALSAFINMELLHLSHISEDVREKVEEILSSEKAFKDQEDEILKVLQENTQNIAFYKGKDQHKNIYLFSLFKLKHELEKNVMEDYAVACLRGRVIKMCGYNLPNKFIEAPRNLDLLLKNSKGQELQESIKQLKLRLDNMPNNMIEQQKLVDEGALSGDQYYMWYYSNIETLKFFLTEIQSANILLEKLGYSLPQNMQELLHTLISEIGRYDSNSILKEIDYFFTDLSLIEAKLDELHPNANRYIAPNVYQNILSEALKVIEATMLGHEHFIENLAGIHPSAPSMRDRLDVVRNKIAAVKEASSCSKIEEMSKFSFFGRVRKRVEHGFTPKREDSDSDRIALSGSSSSSSSSSERRQKFGSQ